MKQSSLFFLLSMAFPTPASGDVLFWDGSTSGNWSTSANWASNTVPAGSAASPDTLSFPATGTNKAMNNNRPAGLSFNRLTFSGDGYSVTGSAITLRILTTNIPTIQYTANSGAATVNLPITLTANTTFSTAQGGRLNLGSLSDPLLVTNTLTLTAGSNGIIEMDGTTSGTGGITMNGAGLVILDANQNATGEYRLSAGSATLLTSTIAGPIQAVNLTQLNVINANASSNVIISGNLSVGLSFDIAGNLFFGSNFDDNLELGIGGTLPGFSYDQIQVGGSVTTAAMRLQLGVAGGYPLGTEFILISKTSAGAITIGNRFLTPVLEGINEGSEVNYGTLRLRFSYTGGDGNDFSATVVPTTTSGTLRTWDGGTDADKGLRTANNWSADLIPIAGSILDFGDAAVEKTVLNNGGGNFQTLQFTGAGGYSLLNDTPGNVGQLLLLSGGGLNASHTTNACTLAVPLVVVANQAWNVSNAGTLNIDAAATAELAGFNLTLNPTSTGTLNLNAPVSGSGNFNKDGSGLAVIGGAVANTYSGTTTISRGELRLSKSSAATALTGNITLGGGANPATLSTTATENIADTAVVTLQTNGTLQLGATETVAALIHNGGTISNGTNTLALGGNFTANQNLVMASPLQLNGAGREITVASGKTLTLSGGLSISPAIVGVTHFKKGPGTLIFSGTAPAVTLQADAGILQLDTTDAVGRPLIALNGGRVQGNGRSRLVTAVTGGGVFSPGLGTGSSIWRNTGLAFNSNTTVEFNLNGTTAGGGFDQLAVLESGTVNLGNAVLRVFDTQAHPVGTTFRIIDNDGTDAVSGTFASLPAGATLFGAFNRYTISYTGGTGNDVVLTAGNLVLTAIQQWRQLHFGTTENSGNASNSFDFDSDGLANLIEFAFGLDPKSAASAALPNASRQGNDLVLSFTPPPGVSGISYFGEASTTLGANSWIPVPNSGITPLKSFRLAITSDRGFLRLRVTEP